MTWAKRFSTKNDKVERIYTCPNCNYETTEYFSYVITHNGKLGWLFVPPNYCNNCGKKLYSLEEDPYWIESRRIENETR